MSYALTGAQVARRAVGVAVGRCWEVPTVLSSSVCS